MLGNHVALIGFVGTDPKMTSVANGTVTVANFTLATSVKRKDKDGQWKEQTTWHHVTFFGKTAENIGRFVKKGSQLAVFGHLNSRKWQAEDGSEHERTEVIGEECKFLPSGSSGKKNDSRPQRFPERPERRDDDFDEDIPY